MALIGIIGLERSALDVPLKKQTYRRSGNAVSNLGTRSALVNIGNRECMMNVQDPTLPRVQA